MKRAIKKAAQAILPRSAYEWARRLRGWKWFRGNYTDWAAAKAASVGYDDARVLDRIAAAATAVRNGHGAWDRDGVVFAEPSLNEPLLQAIRSVAPGQTGWDVVDVGGGLGSVWWQHRDELRRLGMRRWLVVEQPPLVAVGRTRFEDAALRFHADFADASANSTRHLALLSCVLPYVEDPVALLQAVAAERFGHVILDRTPLARDGRRRLTVQHVPPDLGGGSYPAWIFARAEILAPLAGHYELAGEWPGSDDVDPRVEYRGLHFRRRAA